MTEETPGARLQGLDLGDLGEVVRILRCRPLVDPKLMRVELTPLVGGFDPSQKYEFVTWDDEIPNGNIKFMATKPPTRPVTFR